MQWFACRSEKGNRLLAVLLLVSAYSATGDVPYVDANSPSPQLPYTNWATAAHSIHPAVDAAVNGDTVLVTNGLFTVSSDISLTKGILLLSVNGARHTFVNGQNAYRCFYVNHADAVVDGFCITNGAGWVGGGLGFAANGGMVRNCRFLDNAAPSETNLGGYATCSNCCTFTVPPVSSGTVTNAPSFVDAASENYRLAPDSPCLDAGIPAGLYLDMDGTPRPLDGDGNGTAAPDIGAYERFVGTVDSDGDGASDTNEILAGTCPADPDSVFRLLSVCPARPKGPTVLTWSCTSGKVYRILDTASLAAGFTNTVATNVPATPLMNMYTDTVHDTSKPRFYRIELEQQQ